MCGRMGWTLGIWTAMWDWACEWRVRGIVATGERGCINTLITLSVSFGKSFRATGVLCDPCKYAAQLITTR